MRLRFLAPTLAAVSVVFTLSNPAEAQWINHPTPGIPRTADGKPDLTAPTPRASDGKPDLSGIWAANGLGYSTNITSVEMLPSAQKVYRRAPQLTDTRIQRRTACRKVRGRVLPDSSRFASFRHHTSAISCTSRALPVRSSLTEESCLRIPRRVGWGIPSLVGRQTRLSSTPPATTTGPGSTSPVIHTVRRYT